MGVDYLRNLMKSLFYLVLFYLVIWFYYDVENDGLKTMGPKPQV